jgi:HipA-like C-terminal domain
MSQSRSLAGGALFPGSWGVASRRPPREGYHTTSRGQSCTTSAFHRGLPPGPPSTTSTRTEDTGSHRSAHMASIGCISGCNRGCSTWPNRSSELHRHLRIGRARSPPIAVAQTSKAWERVSRLRPGRMVEQRRFQELRGACSGAAAIVRSPSWQIRVQALLPAAWHDGSTAGQEAFPGAGGTPLLIRSLAGDEGYTEYLRRLVTMVIMGNADAHLKNWSLRYPDGRTPRLSPAYDLVYTTIYKNVSSRLTFSLGGENRPDAIGLDEFRAVAGAAGFATETAAQIVHETAQGLRAAWPHVRREKLFPDLVAHLDHRLAHHPLLG